MWAYIIYILSVFVINSFRQCIYDDLHLFYVHSHCLVECFLVCSKPLCHMCHHSYKLISACIHIMMLVRTCMKTKSVHSKLCTPLRARRYLCAKSKCFMMILPLTKLIMIIKDFQSRLNSNI